MVTSPAPINPFARLHLNKKYYYGPQHVLYMALDALGSKHPASLEVVGLQGMGKSSLLRYLANPETLVEYSDKFSEPFRSNPAKLLPVLVEFQYWRGDIGPIQYIFNQLTTHYTIRNSWRKKIIKKQPNQKKIILVIRFPGNR